jgi:hypothetical protein
MDDRASRDAALEDPPCAVHSAGSKRPRTRRCGPTVLRTLHTLSSPCADTPLLVFASDRYPPVCRVVPILLRRFPGVDLRPPHLPVWLRLGRAEGCASGEEHRQLCSRLPPPEAVPPLSGCLVGHDWLNLKSVHGGVNATPAASDCRKVSQENAMVGGGIPLMVSLPSSLYLRLCPGVAQEVSLRIKPLSHSGTNGSNQRRHTAQKPEAPSVTASFPAKTKIARPPTLTRTLTQTRTQNPNLVVIPTGAREVQRLASAATRHHRHTALRVTPTERRT